MKRLTTLLATAALAALALAPAAKAEFGVEPGSFLAKTHQTVPLLEHSSGFPSRRREIDIATIGAEPALTQAGAHPDATTAFAFNQHLNERGTLVPDDNAKDIAVDLPPGFVGNPEAVPACSREVWGGETAVSTCPPASQVGVASIFLVGEGVKTNPVYRLATATGSPASFGFKIAAKPILLEPRLRSDGDYGLTVIAPNASDFFELHESRITFWGVPADPVHNEERWDPRSEEFGSWGAPPGADPEPFLSNPTWCDSGPVDTALRIRSWQDPASWLPDALPAGDPRLEDYRSASPAPTGCERLRFGGPAAPVSLDFQPEVRAAATPSGYRATLQLPYNDNPKGLDNPTLRDTEVTLPEGVVVNPSSANGLAACTSEQIGFLGGGFPAPRPLRFTGEPAECPEASKLATARVTTPLLDHQLTGEVYLAAQGDNPFGSNLAIYIAVDDPATGIVVKLAGEVHTDPGTGRITATFADNPQLPFTELDLRFFGGPGASLVNPVTCGTKTTTSVLTPWSAPHTPPVTSTDSFEVTSGPGGAACASSESELPNSPSFAAGTVNPAAGAFSPFVLRLRREDGTQRLRQLDVTLPPGLTGKLAGVPYCSEGGIAQAERREGVPGAGAAEQADPSCPADSRLGVVDVAAGAGPTPLRVQGTAYLAGPYKGAPLSMAIVTAAVAGPFDLGTVVVRTALHVDPVTAQIRAVSDPIPSVLEVRGDGFPLNVREIALRVDRPDFTLNPTNCAEMGIGGSATSVLGRAATLLARFQALGCRGLDFSPRLFTRLFGGVRRGAHPALRAVLVPRPGHANIGRAAVALPRSEFLDQGNIRTVCTRVQFAADKCPERAIYGRAAATSPLLDFALRGPVYLRSSDNKLPDLVADLRGPARQPIRIELVGRIDSVNGGIRTTFESPPDAPVSAFALLMKGGKQQGLLVNSRNTCIGTNRARANFMGHNGARHLIRPALRNTRCAKLRRKARRAKRAKRAAAGRGGRQSFLGPRRSTG